MRIETSAERSNRLERALIQIKDAANAKRSRFNMPDGLSLQAFVAITLQDIWKMDDEAEPNSAARDSAPQDAATFEDEKVTR